jgi:hypothetical protein
MDRTRILGLLLVTILVSACGSATAPAGTAAAAHEMPPTDPCAEFRDWGSTICPQAIALANARLGWLHWPVTSTSFRTTMCPPNARCAFPGENQGWVIFTFAVGDPVGIHVGPANVGGASAAGLVAGDPEPLPDWLLQEMAGIVLDPER